MIPQHYLGLSEYYKHSDTTIVVIIRILQLGDTHNIA